MQEMALKKVQFKKNFLGGGEGGIPPTPLEVCAFGTHVNAYSAHVHLFHL